MKFLPFLKKCLQIGFGVAAITLWTIGVFYAGRAALHSDFFVLKEVEIRQFPDNVPIQLQGIEELAGLEVGKVNLLSLNLSQVEKRIRDNTWVKEVHLTKRLPHRLVVSVEFRRPLALVHSDSAHFQYLDENAQLFAPMDTQLISDLPVLSVSGETHAGVARETWLKQALQWVDFWRRSDVMRYSQISELYWSKSHGLSGWFVYALPNGTPIRTRVFLGSPLSPHQLSHSTKEEKGLIPSSPSEFSQFRLARVLKYLSEKAVSASSIWIGDGKKIVVKTNPGS